MGLFKSGKPEPVDGAPVPIAEYKVTYRGGLAALPKAKVGNITLQTWGDRFSLQPTIGSRDFWRPLTIPYAAISDVQIVRRQVGTAESILSAGSRNGTRDLQQDNNIHIHYADKANTPVVLRLEMLTGVTVTGQARKAAEFNDLLQARGIRAQFQRMAAPVGAGSLADELAKLQQLAQAGVLSAEEFASAKARLLGQ
jgi:hypothetical protein